MANQINTATAEGRKVLQKQAREKFISNMKADGHTSIAFGADVMPRLQWAKWLAMALAEVGAIPIEAADAVACVLGADLGNSSQLGMALLKEEVLTRQSAANAAQSLASILAERAKAAPPAPAPEAPKAP